MVKSIVIVVSSVLVIATIGCAGDPTDVNGDGVIDEDDEAAANGEEVASTESELKAGPYRCSQAEIRESQNYCRRTACPAEGKTSRGIHFCGRQRATSKGYTFSCACK